MRYWRRQGAEAAEIIKISKGTEEDIRNAVTRCYSKKNIHSWNEGGSFKGIVINGDRYADGLYIVIVDDLWEWGVYTKQEIDVLYTFDAGVEDVLERMLLGQKDLLRRLIYGQPTQASGCRTPVWDK